MNNIIQGMGVLNLMQFRLDFPSEEDGLSRSPNCSGQFR